MKVKTANYEEAVPDIGYDVLAVDEHDIQQMTDEQLAQATAYILSHQKIHRKENAIMYYEPASKAAAQVHQSVARICGVSGGNGSSKTETVFAEAVMLGTGIMPDSFRDDPVFRSKFKGPMKIRIVVESLLNTLWPIMLPKLQWFKWTGYSEPGGEKGHWGWIPKSSLINGKWEDSFNKQERALSVLCRDPDNRRNILGETVFTFMSKDNDPEDFASGDYDIVIEDEPPSEAIHRENEARTMRMGGRILLSMTWPDDPTIPVGWIYDEIYEPGSPGPNKNPKIDWFELDTRDNPHLLQSSVEDQITQWSDEMVEVRIKGQPLVFSNRIHPLFTDRATWWCFNCHKAVSVLEIDPPERTSEQCSTCKNSKVVVYNHVIEQNFTNWPVVYLLDPHPRKNHMMSWWAVDPTNDWYGIAEAQVDGDCGDVHEEVRRIEDLYKLQIAKRLIDPNMGASPASQKRGVRWVDEFSTAGVHCDLADDSSVGRKRIDNYLRPDPDTLAPRIHINPRCLVSIKQIKRYQWQNYKVGAERGVKQEPKPIDDDFPTLLKYLANYDPDFRFLKEGPRIISRRRGRNDGRPVGRRAA